MNTFKLIAWESIKLLMVITYTVIICANIIMCYYTIQTQRALDVIYQDIHDQHLELMNEIKN